MFCTFLLVNFSLFSSHNVCQTSIHYYWFLCKASKSKVSDCCGVYLLSNRIKKMDESIEVIPKQLNPESKRKRRKSSFMRGRRSSCLPSVKTSELFQNIPETLPSEERLLSLLHSCFQHALRNVGGDFFPVEGTNLNEFITLGNDAFDEVHDKLKQICTLAVTVQDSANLRIEEEIENYSKYYERLKSEISEWDAALATDRELLQHAANTQSIDCGSLLNTDDSLNEIDTFKEDCNGQYMNIIERINELSDRLQIQVDVIAQSSKMMDKCLKIAKNKISDGLNINQPVQDSPRTLLQKLCRRNEDVDSFHHKDSE